MKFIINSTRYLKKIFADFSTTLLVRAKLQNVMVGFYYFHELR